MWMCVPSWRRISTCGKILWFFDNSIPFWAGRLYMEELVLNLDSPTWRSHTWYFLASEVSSLIECMITSIISSVLWTLDFTQMWWSLFSESTSHFHHGIFEDLNLHFIETNNQALCCLSAMTSLCPKHFPSNSLCDHLLKKNYSKLHSPLCHSPFVSLVHWLHFCIKFTRELSVKIERKHLKYC